MPWVINHDGAGLQQEGIKGPLESAGAQTVGTVIHDSLQHDAWMGTPAPALGLLCLQPPCRQWRLQTVTGAQWVAGVSQEQNYPGWEVLPLVRGFKEHQEVPFDFGGLLHPC